MDGEFLPEQPRREQPPEVALKQYETFVQWTEQLIDRRAEANRFYSGINTAIFGAAGFLLFGEKPPDHGNQYLLLAFPFAGLSLSFIWLRVLHSHRAILKRKFEVIHHLEKSLPFQPYTLEYQDVDLGDDTTVPLDAPQSKKEKAKKRKKPGSSTFERSIPALFLCLHTAFLLFLSWMLFPETAAQLWQSLVEPLRGAAEVEAAPQM